MIRAKLSCVSVTKMAASEQVVLVPVYSSDPTSENYSWSKATPSGEVKLTITNEAAFGAFTPGRSYIASFESAE